MINTYDELAKIIMDAFTNENLNSNIIVGSTNNIKWQDVVTDENVVYGVLLPSGGTSVKVENGLLRTESLVLTLALPDNVKDQYFIALEKVKTAIKNFIVVPHEIAGDTYVFGDNGLQALDFRAVNGKRVGIISQNLISQIAGNMLDVSDAIVKIVASDDDSEPTSDDTTGFLFGMYHYTFGKIKNFDPVPIKKDDMEKSAYRSQSISLAVDYYKIKENALHKLLLADKPYFYITVYDGEDNLLENFPMHITNYTQDGIVGGYTNVKVTFGSGVITNS